jgi:hypothetical protein
MARRLFPSNVHLEPFKEQQKQSTIQAGFMIAACVSSYYVMISDYRLFLKQLAVLS